MTKRLFPLASLMLTAVLFLGMACDGGGQTGGQPYDPTRDFVPGNPNFKRDPALDVEIQSAANDQRSHNLGENCLRCHQELGPGRGRFTLAGTLYDENGQPFPNALLKLFGRVESADGGPIGWGTPVVFKDELMTIPVDGLGNFYTTTTLPNGYPQNPVYPRFFGPNGEELLQPHNDQPAQMAGGVTVGGCNYCHGTGFRVMARMPQ